MPTDPKKLALLIGVGPKPPMEQQADPLDQPAQDLIDSVHDKDPEGVKAAIRAMFLTLDSQPHQEGPSEAAEG